MAALACRSAFALLRGWADMALDELPTELPDLDPSAPAGPNLEFDAAFGELERTSQGKPEQQYGDTVIPGEDPNWKDVAALAWSLTGRTHDLRVLVQLAISRLQLAGLEDFTGVLGLIHHQLQACWESVHPQLDPEDDNDPTLRANALLRLAEPVRVLRALRNFPLALSRRDGPVSWRTISIFNGGLETTDEQERKSEQSIRAAFGETGAERLTARRASIERALSELAGINLAFDSQSGYGNAPDLSGLVKLLQEMSRFIAQYMPAADAVPDEAPMEDASAGGAPGQPAASSQASRGGMSIASITDVNSRADAMRLLDLVVRYYEQHEPSSPLPLLVSRARKLADKGFLEILQELAPDGLMQAQVIVQSRES
jgi:type VI secretion system protein ImpA